MTGKEESTLNDYRGKHISSAPWVSSAPSYRGRHRIRGDRVYSPSGPPLLIVGIPPPKSPVRAAAAGFHYRAGGPKVQIRLRRKADSGIIYIAKLFRSLKGDDNLERRTK